MRHLSSLLWCSYWEHPWTGHKNPGELFHFCVLGRPSAQLLCLCSTVVMRVWRSSIQNEPRLSLQDKVEERVLPESSRSICVSSAAASQHQQGKLMNFVFNTPQWAPSDFPADVCCYYFVFWESFKRAWGKPTLCPLIIERSRRGCFDTQLKSRVLRLKRINIT